MALQAGLFRGLGVLAAVAGALFFFQGTPAAEAAPGNVLGSIALPASVGGVSVAFDGQYLYYTDLGMARDETIAKDALALAISGTPDATSASQIIATVGRALISDPNWVWPRG